MDKQQLETAYRAYIDTLNARDWDRLGDFVADSARHNGRPFGLSGYRTMLEQDVEAIPDLVFGVDFLVIDPPHVAARLTFHCTPKGEFLGLPVHGRTVDFTENVFYRFQDGRIADVWSVIDKQAIEEQL
ncbi:ester cyclase [Rhizobium halophytocola]|uniref:Ester cyclase n=1 Tax=Rhizobium halophytocola TaxID=735519 RepID=A0ABS4DTL6_9HYPH|nr:ester cyclase [Rhizobium halophytocola]MBP1849032.1 putative ester cyclase [Rhizobium halophytocola]